MFAEDTSLFMSDFAITARIGVNEVAGILSQAYVESGFVESSAPIFTCKTLDIDGVVHGNTVTTGEDNYKIRGIKPDGTGMTTLILELQ
jgi:hypothetical protein